MITKNRKVTIKSLVKKYKFASFYSVPHQDTVNRSYFTGESSMPIELKKSKFVVKHDDIVPISHAMTLNMEREEDQCKYFYMLELEEVSNRLADAVPGKHLFYIEDVEKEAEISVDKDEQMIKAFEILASNMSGVKLSNILFFLQRDPRNLTENIKKQIVFTEAKTNPSNILRALSDNGKHQIFISKLFFHQIIKVNKGMYMYGDVFLGNDVEEAVLFTMNPKNSRITDTLGQQLMSKEGRSATDDAPLKMEVTMPNGEIKEIDEDEADSLLTQYSLKVADHFKLNGKVGVLQKNFDSIKE